LKGTIGSDLQEIRSAVLAQAIQEGDTVVEQIIRRAAEKIGMAVGNLVTILCPDVIVLGGGLVEALPHLFLEPVATMARSICMPPLADFFKVVVAKLADDASVMGAAAWAEECSQNAKTSKK